MTRFDAPSRCTQRAALDFRWYGFPKAANGKDLEVATDAFMEALSGPSRLWNPYNKAMVRSEFRDRVAAAKNGQLKPVDHVKSVDEDNPPPLYEIRWQDVTVTERTENGGLAHPTVLVRMYHSEPPAVPTFFIGHHIHQKVTDGDVNAQQDAEIAIAKKFYDSGEPHLWGVKGFAP
jgi:hypothetical protein